MNETVEEELDFKELDNDINWASQEIKAAIKYKLISNLYRAYLGISIPYNRMMNGAGNIFKEKVLDKALMLRIGKFRHQHNWKLMSKVF